MEHTPPSSKQNELIQQVIFLHQTGRLPEAADQYQKLLKILPNHPQLLSGLGILALQQSNHAQAEAVFAKFLQAHPNQPTAWSNHGTALTKLHRLDEAVASYDKAIALKPDYALAYNNRGLALHELNRHEAALASYDHAIGLQAEYTEAYFNRGLTFQALGLHENSLADFQQAIALNPHFAEAYYQRARVFQELNRFDEAQAGYAKALALKPDYADVFVKQGIEHQDRRQFAAAISNYDQALALKPDFAEVYVNRGLALQELNRLDAAAASYEKAIAIKPDFAEAYNNLGIARQKLKNLSASLESYENAIALKPDYADTYNNQGLARQELREFQAALSSFETAITLRPDYPEAYYNRALVLEDMREFEAAFASFDQAIALKPDYAAAYWNKALLKILIGEYEEGWALYEWRWRDQQRDRIRNFSQPLWLGEPALAGKTVLIHCEQGLGDFIQFCRYMAKLEALGANVILEAPKPLVSLLRTLKGRLTIVEQGQTLPAFDFYCPIMSLPLAFKTRVENIPAAVPYLFADGDKRQVWHQRLGQKTKTRVGLVWAGARENKNDHKRSIPLELLEPLLQLPFEFHCLQKEIAAHEMDLLNNLGKLHAYCHEINDFTDTAALVEEMDLVISVDTSVAHLAGALAKPVWILLPSRPDYRWMLNRTDSPWYPTATLFRRDESTGWPGVISAVAQNLTRWRQSAGANPADRYPGTKNPQYA